METEAPFHTMRIIPVVSMLTGSMGKVVSPYVTIEKVILSIWFTWGLHLASL